MPMPNDAQKTSFARSMEQFAQRKASAAIELFGKSLPASIATVVSSGIVVVKFELTNIPFTIPNLKVPVCGSEFIRLPLKVGMLGWVISASAYLGGMSGLGGGTADLSQRPSLSNLVWSPIGNVNWTATDDPNAVVIYGPDGVIVRTMDKKRTLSVTTSGASITVQEGDVVSIGATGTLQALLNAAAATVFNNHTLSGNGQPPTQQMVAADMTSLLKAE